MQAVPVEKRHVGVALPCHDPVAELEVAPVVRQVGGREGNPVVDAAVTLSGFLLSKKSLRVLRESVLVGL